MLRKSLLSIFYILSFISIKAQSEIIVLMSDNLSIYQQTITGLQSSLEYPLKVYYWSQIQNQYGNNIIEFFKNLENQKFIITIGDIATFQALGYLKKTKIIFSHVTNIHKLNINDNICGIDVRVPIESYFKLFKEINPSFRNILTITTTDSGKIIALEGIYKDLSNQIYFIHEHITGTEINRDFKSTIEKYKDKIDGFYIVEDPVYTIENLNYLSTESIKNQFMILVKYDSLLNVGGTIAIYPDYTKIGIKMGTMVSSILNNSQSCKELFIQTLKEGDLFYSINEEQAKKQNIVIPEVLIKRSSLSRLYTFGVELYQNNKIQSAEKIFKKILEEDPQNPGANYYFSLIIDKKTGEVTKLALNKATEFYRNKQYDKALEQINYGLKVNPIHEELNQLKKIVVNEYSIMLAQKAKGMENKEPFESIRLYQRSLQLNPENSEANSQLASLRNQLSRKIPEMMNQAKSFFESRKYKETISLLNNVLLIQPGNTLAVEYLRLSQQKQESLENILKNQ